MDVYLLRHGFAMDREEAATQDIDDADRPLTGKGRRDVNAVARYARRLGIAPDHACTSSLRRATETLEVAGKAMKLPDPVVTASLLPEASPEALWTELRAIKDSQSVLAVGHRPHIRTMAEYLLGSKLELDFKKGALVRITLDSEAENPRGVLRWMITPKLARIAMRS